MVTYNLQPRVFAIRTKGGKLEFPNKGIIEMKLGPSNVFGGENKPGRTALYAQKNKLIYNTNTGRMLVQPVPPLQPLNVLLEDRNYKIELNGEILRCETFCQNILDLEEIILTFYFHLPAILNLNFPDPPIVLSIKGLVGAIEFDWVYHKSEFNIYNVNKDILEGAVVEAFELLSSFSGAKNIRLFSSLNYFHVASRLIVCGNSPWEFMAECILNLSKSLETLFVESENSRDDIRNGLRKIGYSSDEIEGDFIPILILRNFLDVGHPKISVHNPEHRIIIYDFLYNTEIHFRKLFKKLLKEIVEGRFKLKQEIDFEPSGEDKRKMEKLIEVLKSRINLNK
jgi:hypothetical protein